MRLSITLISWMFISACGSAQMAPDVRDPALVADSNWTIELVVSGGFAGIVQSLQVSDDGTLIAQDKKRDVLKISHLSARELDQLEKLLSTLEFTEKQDTAPRFGQKCADCMHYRLRLTRDDRHHSVEFNSLELSKLPYAQLLRALVEMLRRTLTSA